MKFISAGHCNVRTSPNYDPGAVNGKLTEAMYTERIRNGVIAELVTMGYSDIVRDMDGESLGQYLKRIQPGSGSVVIEFHLNSAANKTATGCSVLVGTDADRLDKMAATEFANATAALLCVRNRGVISEALSHRGRLGLMREQGIVILVEVCFISNPEDMAKLDKNIIPLCQTYAHLIAKYDDLLK